MDDEVPRPAGDERRARTGFRLVAAAVILMLIVFLVVADVIGRLFVRPDFHIGDAAFLALLGALVTLTGVEVAGRLPWAGPKS